MQQTISRDVFTNIVILSGNYENLKRFYDNHVNPNVSNDQYRIALTFKEEPTQTLDDEIKHYRDRANRLKEALSVYVDPDINDHLHHEERHWLLAEFITLIDRFKQRGLLPFTALTQVKDAIQLNATLTQTNVEDFLQHLQHYDVALTQFDFAEETTVATENFGFTLLTPDELSTEDQVVHFTEDDNLVFTTYSKGSNITEFIQETCQLYGIEGVMLFANEDGTVKGEYRYEDGTMFFKQQEPSLADTVAYLEQVGQLEQHLDKFGWTMDDVYPEVDDETYIRNAPAFGVE